MKRGKFNYSAPPARGGISRSVSLRPAETKEPTVLTKKPSTGKGPGRFHGTLATTSCLKSPRKRMRSPPPLSASSDDHFGKQKFNRPSISDEEEVDELDFLGTAALVQFEQTQCENDSESTFQSLVGSTSVPSTVPMTHSISTTKGFDHEVILRNCEKNSRDGNLELSAPAPHLKPQSSDGVTSSSLKDLEERVRQLQELIYTNDGEVKVLRNEKEKFLAELRKKDEQLNQLQAQMTMNKKTGEQRAAKERDSLLTRLQFKEQENRALQEKNAELEQRQKLAMGASSSSSLSRLPAKSQPLRNSPRITKKTKGWDGRGAFTPSPSQSTEFLSTETFMPLSQLSSGAGSLCLNSVPVASSRIGAKDDRRLAQKEFGPGGRKAKDVRAKPGASNRSRSISPSPSDTKKMRRKSKSDKGNCGGTSEDLEGLYGLESAPRSSKEQKVESQSIISLSSSQFSVLKPNNEAFYLVSVPSRDIDGSQLLMLLSRHDLLKPPVAATTAVASTLASSNQQGEKSCQVTRGSAAPSFPSSSSHSMEFTGLLSLLSLEARHASASYPATHSTPVRHSVNLSSPLNLGSTSSLDLSSPSSLKTPTRKPRLLPQKPHTLGRIHGRVRHNSGLLVSMKMKSVSATNTPEKIAYSFGHQDSVSRSLISSISTRSLQSSISSLLASSEVLRFAAPAVRNRIMKQKKESKERQQHLDILRQISNVIISYHGEQLQKMQSAQSSGLSSYCEGSYDSLDATLFVNARSPPNRTTNSASEYSSSGSSFYSLVGIAPSPMTGNQQYVAQALSTLDTLVAYSRTVREQIFLEPPEFVIDSRPSSSLGMHQNSSVVAPPSAGATNESSFSPADGGGKMDVEDEEREVGKKAEGGEGVGSREHLTVVSTLAKVSHRLLALQDPGSVQEVANSLEQEEFVKCKNFSKLVPLNDREHSKLSDSTWGVCDDRGACLDPMMSSRLQPQCSKETGSDILGSGCGKLFSVLLELLYCPWVESRDNLVTCVHILVGLARDCSAGALSRFSPLLQKDTISLCLEREDHTLTSSLLSLLLLLVRSDSLLESMCSNGEPCILATLYQHLQEPLPLPVSPSVSETKSGGGGGGGEEDGCGREDYTIQSQIVQLLSRIIVCPKGPPTLFEKCSCSHVCLRSLVMFLERLIDGISQVSQLSQTQLDLVMEVLSLVYKVSNNDRFFDSHRESCEHAYSYVFNKLGVILSALPQASHEIAIVNELLTYCEEFEDSPRESSQEEDPERNSI